MVPDLTELVQGQLESRMRQEQGGGESGTFNTGYNGSTQKGPLTPPQRDQGRHPGGRDIQAETQKMGWSWQD